MADHEEPADVAATFERGMPLPPGPGDRFTGYAVLGVPFRSGDVLALRRFPVTSNGSGYTSVWHRAPDGAWTIYADVGGGEGCSRYFAPAIRDTVVTPIRIEWTSARNLTVAADGGRLIAWTVALAPTPSTRLLNRIVALVPVACWADERALKLFGFAAGVALGAGRVSLAGETPSGSRFLAHPRKVWAVCASRASIAGRDLGPVGPITPQPALGDWFIPRRGLFAAGSAVMRRQVR
jgi:hypothetical protein